MHDPSPILLAIRRSARRATDALGRWTGSVRSVVTASPISGGVLLTERGESRSPNDVARLPAIDTTRWTIESGTLRIAHTRGGDPVPLASFPLDALTSGGWADSIEPHHCPPDVYHASLRIEPATVWLRWRIETPRGVEGLVVRYRAGAPHGA